MREVLHMSFAACTVMAALLGFVTPTLADGKLYFRERVPPEVPYQRAIIMHDAGVQTMVLQTAFVPREVHDGARHDADAPLGWVVPLPSVPELSSLPKNSERNLFLILDMMTAPRVTRIRTVLVAAAFIAPIGYVLVGIALWIVPTRRTFQGRWFPLHRLALVVIALTIGAILMPTLGTARMQSGIEVLKSEEIGVFDAKVIRATDSEELITWLNEHGFEFTPGDRPVLDDYIRHDWCFVVALVRDEERRRVENNVDRLIDPLVMRFDADAPIYPLALTATIGSDTEVLIYLLSNVRRDGDGRLPLRRARPFDDGVESWFEDFSLMLEPGSDAPRHQLTWLAKFKGTLTSVQMRHDLTFTPSAETKPYREHLVRW